MRAARFVPVPALRTATLRLVVPPWERARIILGHAAPRELSCGCGRAVTCAAMEGCPEAREANWSGNPDRTGIPHGQPSDGSIAVAARGRVGGTLYPPAGAFVHNGEPRFDRAGV